MSRSHMKLLGRAALSALAAISLLAASCSDDDDDIVDPPTSEESSTTTSTTSTTSSTSSTTETTEPPASTDEAIIERYLDFWDARLAANQNPPNPDDPALAEFATGAQLDVVRTETRQRLEDGVAIRKAEPSQERHDVRVVSSSEARAELQDCSVSDGVLYRVDTGEVIDDSVVTRNVSAVMVIEDGKWKLEQATVVQEWEGFGGCALAAS